jgi:uncharacterized metal-binding protein YceD (DUF177 family)
VKISIDELKALPQHRLNLSYREDLAGLQAIKPVVGELSIVYSTTGMRLTGHVTTLLKLQCDRCLRPYFQSLSVEIEERFVPESLLNLNEKEQQREGRELLRDDFVEPVPDNGFLDISDIVYQAVTLETPTFCLCGDDCPGPPQSAKASDQAGLGGTSGSETAVKQQAQSERPIDPRWKNLKTLFPNEDSSENS